MKVNRYAAEVEAVDHRRSTAHLRLDRGRLIARPWPGILPGERAAVRIRPEDVLLCTHHPGLVSARNVLAGHVHAVRLVPEGAYVTVGAGFRLAALVTRDAVRELGIRPGTPLFAVVKAAAVVPDVAVHARFRVSAVGPHGVLDPAQLDLLRAIERTGSLTAAAEDVGITYRSAWTWVDEANAAWGAPLVAAEKGGRGGGGAALTPAGRSLLDACDRREAP